MLTNTSELEVTNNILFVMVLVTVILRQLCNS